MSLRTQVLQADLCRAAMLDLAHRTLTSHRHWCDRTQDQYGRVWHFVAWSILCRDLLPGEERASQILARTAAQEICGGIGRFDVEAGVPLMLEATDGPVLICESKFWEGLWLAQPTSREKIVTRGYATTLPTKPRQKGPCPDSVSTEALAAFLRR